MRRILFCILFGVCSFSAFSQPQWKWITPNPPYKSVYSSTQVDSKAYFWCDDNTVIKLDVPTEKFEVLPTYAPLENVALGDFTEQGIAFADSLIGYITDVAYGEFRTTDGGQHWLQTADPGSNAHLVVFGSNLRGWKLGGGGFYRTDNAGANWSYISAPFFGGYGYFSKMFALNENQLWVLISFNFSETGGSIWYSSNGGNNWDKINTGLISDSLNQVTYTDFKMNDSGIGFAAGYIIKPDSNITKGFIQRTTDMGVTWSIVKFNDERYKNILSINDYDWVILGNIGYYNNSKAVQRSTTDMGDSWFQSFPLEGFSNNTRFYNAIYALEKNTIYMFATYGIYKSSNKGNSYTKITSETDVLVSQVVFDSKPKNPNTQIGIAWLKWNTKPYIISFDAGYTWHQKSLPQSMGYIWLVGIAEEVIYMIVNQTQLYKSTDFGDSWIQLNVPVYSGLQALDVYSKDVIVLNTSKNLISSTDGGDTWIKGPTVENLWLEETDIVSPGKIVGVGSYFDSSGTRGLFFNTSNYGLSWHIVDVDKQLHEVQMLNDRIGYALGENKIYKTSNTGESWNIILSKNSYFREYSSFAFYDSLNGIVSASYKFRRTTNGGAGWSNEDQWVSLRGIDRMVYNANGDLFAIGGAVMLMFPSIRKAQPERKNITENVYSDYHLYQNYPNPFNPTTRIKFTIPTSPLNPSPYQGEGQRERLITLKIYDVLGSEITTLVNEEKPAGEYEVEFNAEGLPSGVYFYRLSGGEFIQTKKMVLLK